jgi:hypothetical protein
LKKVLQVGGVPAADFGNFYVCGAECFQIVNLLDGHGEENRHT